MWLDGKWEKWNQESGTCPAIAGPATFQLIDRLSGICGYFGSPLRKNPPPPLPAKFAGRGATIALNSRNLREPPAFLSRATQCVSGMLETPMVEGGMGLRKKQGLG